jgi:hypothetical protein
MYPGIRRLALAAVVSLSCVTLLHARPAHKRALADYFGPFLAPKLNDCRTCHLPDAAGESANGASEKPHNPFGARLKAVKKELRKAGKPITIAARLEAIADEDSDGDGVSNLLELLSGHYPGDPSDKPTAAEVAKARETLAAFRKSKEAYPWQPFEKVKRPAVPVVKNAAWVRTPIDAFLAAEHEKHGLVPRPEAPRAVLLRRVYLDLTGLPPTPEELHAFLTDPSADAYEQVVDRLLASPRYGERWGRHWMDIWRYSDWAGWTDGGQIRDSQRHIWRWRDWIVEALNRDKGYDRMILEMLGADELAPEDPDALRATGYLVRNYKMLSREKWMQDTVDHTAMAFLGVTLGCARCHDHMYDPLTQKEYYQVRAIFEPHQVRIDRLPGQPDIVKDGLVHVYDAKPDAPTFLYFRGDERTPDKTPLVPGVPEALGGHFPAVEAVRLPQAAYAPDKREFVIRETLAAAQRELTQARSSLQPVGRGALPVLAGTVCGGPMEILGRLAAARKTLDGLTLAQMDSRLAEARLASLQAVLQVEKLEDAGQKGTAPWKQAALAASAAQRQAAVLEAWLKLLTACRDLDRNARSDSRWTMAKEVNAAVAALAQAEAATKRPPTTAYTPRPIEVFPTASTGRRLAFARWIADRSNPLTARVAMNHIWLRHFGQAIVPSVFDFGRNGRPPSHSALLDWLAAELMDSGWHMKALHRLIVTSSAYRMASTADPADVARDRDNQYLWRMPSRRMEAEAVRDCIFYVAGKLDLTMGGPDIDQHQGLTIPRRSIYFRHAAEKQMEFLKIFDGAAVTECYQRKESVMPQQALALANSELTLRHARLLARELASKAGGNSTTFMTAAFERTLSRPPTAAEMAECQIFLTRQTEHYRGSNQPGIAEVEPGSAPAFEPGLRARENLVHVLLNHNDFVTIR